MKRVLQLQKQRNKKTQDDWSSYAGHRRFVTDLLTGAVDPAGKRIAILGAGNCNDIELPRLGFAYDEVHLVDLDDKALALGVEKQLPTAPDNVVLHGKVDLTGATPLLDKFQPDTPAATENVEKCIQQARHAAPAKLGQPFDVVSSNCLLTQLFDSACHTLGEQHPQFVDLILALRWGHLRLMLELLRPGGMAILFTDVVSSTTWLGLDAVPDEQLPEMLDLAVQAGNFFTGANPFAIAEQLRSDPDLHPQVGKVQVVRPWKWQMGHRTYVVSAIAMQKAAADAPN